jgi:hypothetical protein
MNKEKSLKKKISDYCEKYNIPEQYLFDILEDQKVTPMIRGKALEYSGYLKLQEVLSLKEWIIQKLNLNAQPGFSDQDISITHRRSGIILKIETKSAVRDSFSTGKRARIVKEPHFKIKSHRSRSNIKLAGSSNDKYDTSVFDVILTTPINSIYKGNTITGDLILTEGNKKREILKKFYNASTNREILTACQKDWRFAIPEDIAIDGYVPRTPYVKLADDENWGPVEEIENRLLELVRKKR